MRYLLQLLIRHRDNHMPWKFLSIKQQIFDHYQRLVFIFVTKPKDIAVYCDFSRIQIVVLT